MGQGDLCQLLVESNALLDTLFEYLLVLVKINSIGMNMFKNSHRALKRALGAAAVAFLSACGGGGGAPSTSSQGVDVINGITVPPMPEASANQATLAGLDSNTNGIRDDIERQIATDFGAIPERFAVVSEHAQLLQIVIVSPAAAATTAYINQTRCISNREVLGQLDTLSRRILDTPMRKKSYGSAMAGALINIEGC